MKTLQKNDTKKTQTQTRSTQSILKPKAPPATPKSETKAPAAETKPVDDKISLSKASVAENKTSKSEERGQDKGFASFLDNFKNGFSDVTEEKKKTPGLGELKGKELKEKLDSLPAEKKEKAVLDSLKGLKGEELTNRLAELDKVDKELADKLREKLGLKTEDKTKPEEKNKEEDKPVEKAGEAKKASEGDTGAPSETFLWKPTSESDGKLVILLPTSVSARSVTISGPNVNQTVSKGGQNGKRANGQREHFRFGKGGKDMEGPVQVTVQLENGQKKTMNIANPAQRNEGGKLQDGGQPAF